MTSARLTNTSPRWSELEGHDVTMAGRPAFVGNRKAGSQVMRRILFMDTPQSAYMDERELDRAATHDPSTCHRCQIGVN